MLQRIPFQRRRRDLDETNPLFDDYALTPPTFNPSQEEEDEPLDLSPADVEEDTTALPNVVPSPDYEDSRDPVTRYVDYGVDEYKKLADQEFQPLERRGPWHQILGGLASMSPITAGLAPNLVYKNYDAYKNQEAAFKQQQEKAELEQRNRASSLSAGASGYSTDVRQQQDQWNRTTGLEIEARMKGWAPANQTPQENMLPNVPPQTINGVKYVQLKDPDNVSFSYLTQNADTGTNSMVVLHKDGTITTSDTGIKFVERRDSSNLNSLMLDIAQMRQMLESGNLSEEQARKIQADLAVKEETVENIKKTGQEEIEFREKTRSKYRPNEDGDTQPYSSIVRETIQYWLSQGKTPQEAERLALEQVRGPKAEETRTGFRTAAEAGRDAERVTGNLATVGDFEPGVLSFIPGLGGVTDEEAVENIKTANRLIIDQMEATKGSRKENVSDFLVSLGADTKNLPKELQKNFKEYTRAYNQNLPILMESGDDIWYHPTEEEVITAQEFAQAAGVSLEEARQMLQADKFRQLKFATR